MHATDLNPDARPATAPVDPVEVVGALYAAFGRGDVEGMLALIDEDVDWSLDVRAPGAERVPMLRNGRGHAAVSHYFSGVADMDFHRFEPRRSTLVAPDTVIVELAVGFTHRGTGKAAAFEELHRFVVGDGGRVVSYRPFADTAALIEAFTPSHASPPASAPAAPAAAHADLAAPG